MATVVSPEPPVIPDPDITVDQRVSDCLDRIGLPLNSLPVLKGFARYLGVSHLQPSSVLNLAAPVAGERVMNQSGDSLKPELGRGWLDTAKAILPVEAGEEQVRAPVFGPSINTLALTNESGPFRLSR